MGEARHLHDRRSRIVTCVFIRRYIPDVDEATEVDGLTEVVEGGSLNEAVMVCHRERSRGRKVGSLLGHDLSGACLRFASDFPYGRKPGWAPGGEAGAGDPARYFRFDLFAT